MPQSLASVYLHAVFSTKHRTPFFTEERARRDVHALLAGVTSRLDCLAIEVGGYEDHVHVLARFGKEITIATWLRELKRVSSSELKQNQPDFAWQAGYGPFSVDAGRLEAVQIYIRNQAEHHRKVSFQDEFRELMREHRIEWNEAYLWD